MKHFIFAAVILVSSCRIQEGPPTPSPIPVPDSDLIGEMCVHLAELGCEEGKSVYNDSIEGPVDVPNQSCKDFYTELQDAGYFVNPRCITKVPSCKEIEQYRQKKPEECSGT